MSQKKKTTAQSKRPRKAPSNQTGGTAWGKKVAAAISGKMQSTDMKKLILLNFPYIIAFYMVEKAAWLYRHCNGDTIVDRLMVLFMNFGLAYKSSRIRSMNYLRIWKRLNQNTLPCGSTKSTSWRQVKRRSPF